MQLSELISICKGAKLLCGNGYADIRGLASDDRRSGKGYLFFCKGEGFKLQYAKNAIDSGASAIFTEAKWTDGVLSFCSDVAVVEVKSVAIAMGICSAHFYCYPMEKLKTVAVTGTKGKTTTAHYINSILNQKKEYKSALLSEMTDSDAPRLTTPEAIDFHKAAARALGDGCTHLVCEISSQSEKAYRTYGITFDISCFLNFGRDHISKNEHRSLNEYFLCKASIVAKSRKAVINADSLQGRKIMGMLDFKTPKITFSAKGKNADYICESYEMDGYGCDALLSKKKRKESFKVFVPIVGEHNVQNALCAASVAMELGVGKNETVLGLALSRPKGRSEILYSTDKRLCIVIDYAHNGMSFTAIAKAAREQLGAKTLTAVFGLPGDKAQCRRYQVALACVKNVDKAIICEDDSGNEGYESIKTEMQSCFEKAQNVKNAKMGIANVTFIENRAQAISLAVKNAYENGDDEVILLLGKGAEEFNRGNNEEIQCESDIALAKRALSEYDRQCASRSVALQNTQEDILVCLGNDFTCVNRIVGIFPLVLSGARVSVLCNTNDFEQIENLCFENGIACYGLDIDKEFGEEASLKGTATVPVFYTEKNVYKSALKILEKGKIAKIVYLGLREGILVRECTTLSPQRAELIFSALKSENSAHVLKAAERVSEIAILNGLTSGALDRYIRLGVCDGAVIRDDAKRG